MKTLITNYTFDSSTSEIQFLSLSSITLEKILLITNVTQNTIIYNFADPLKGGSVLGNSLILDYDTISMEDTDSLQIYYDVENYKTLVDDTTTLNTIYIGKSFMGAAKGEAVWQIQKLDDTLGLEQSWADGDDLFDNIWVNRATTIVYS